MKQTIINQIRDAVAARLGAGYAVSVHTVTKNNGLKLTGLTIQGSGETICPTIYIDQYADRTEGELLSIADEIVASYKEHKPTVGLDFDFGSKEAVLSKVGTRLINAERNADVLAGQPHKDFLDLAITYRMEFSIDGQLGTAAITNQMCERLGITVEELDEAATKNKKEFNIRSMQEVMREMLGQQADYLCGDEDEMPMYVITNSEKCYGACAMTYTSLLKGLADKLDSDLYILPSSVHEVLAIPTSVGDPEQLTSMVCEVNNTQVQADEVLSNHAYKYDRETGSVQIVAA